MILDQLVSFDCILEGACEAVGANLISLKGAGNAHGANETDLAFLTKFGDLDRVTFNTDAACAVSQQAVLSVLSVSIEVNVHADLISVDVLLLLSSKPVG